MKPREGEINRTKFPHNATLPFEPDECSGQSSRPEVLMTCSLVCMVLPAEQMRLVRTHQPSIRTEDDTQWLMQMKTLVLSQTTQM